MIVLDTHIWLWWVNRDTGNLAQCRIEQIANADIVAVSAISCFEVAWLEHHGRIALGYRRKPDRGGQLRWWRTC